MVTGTFVAVRDLVSNKIPAPVPGARLRAFNSSECGSVEPGATSFGDLKNLIISQ